MNIVVILNPKVKIAGRSSLVRAHPTVGGQETTSNCWKTETDNRGLFAGSDLRTWVGDLFKMRPEAANRRQAAGLYRFGF